MTLLSAPAAPAAVLPAVRAPRRSVAAVGPHWFASVMGTSIVAVAAVSLPVGGTAPALLARGVWVLAGVVLVLVTAATVAQRLHHPERARAHAANPVMAHFYGAPPMALLAFGTATLLVGRDVLGAGPAVAVAMVLWAAGTAGGLVTAVLVPFWTFTRHEGTDEAAFAGWLMPVVPPMVSAAGGALLLPHVPAGQVRLGLLVACCAMFGMSLIASLVILPLLWARLARHSVGPAAMVPTLWIVLGPLGQSVTAAHSLTEAAAADLPPALAPVLRVLGLVYGLPVWGFALLWGALALAVTVRTARAHLPFSLTWWSFTFPVGTVVTGTSGLAQASGSAVLAAAAVVLFAGLLAAWLTVAARTVAGVRSGVLLRA